MDQEGKESNIKLSVRIPVTLTIIVVVTGIIAFIKISAKLGQFPMPYFIAWIIGSVLLIGISIWSWLRNKKRQ